jgi:hypothetical protein
MTSFTRKLYNRDPAAARAFEKAQAFERQLVYGRTPTLACFTPSHNGLHPSFGKRMLQPQSACASSCGHPACKDGCTLIMQNGASRRMD